MSKREFYQGESVVDVMSAMYTEGCGHCIDCPNATMAGAQVVHRHNLLNELVTLSETSIDIIEDIAQDLDDAKDHLQYLTSDCVGYRKSRTPDAPRPAQLCNSPEVDYQRIEIIAGRIGEFIGLLIPSFMKSE